MKQHDKLIAKSFFEKASGLAELAACRLDPMGYEAELMARDAFADPMDFGALFPKLLILYYHNESPYFAEKTILEKAKKCLLRFSEMLRENGTLDDLLAGTHSMSRTADTIIFIFPALSLIENAASRTEEEDALLSLGKETLRRMANALVDGGFRDGYQRWLIVAALAVAEYFLGDERYSTYAGTLLAQGVKMSADGEYPDKNHEISLRNDRAFFLTATYRRDKSFLSYPKAHLRAARVLFETDGGVTNIAAYGWNQTPKASATGYYPIHLAMAITDGDSEAAHIADSLADGYLLSCTEDELTELMLFFMSDKARAEKQEALAPTAPVRENSVFFEEGKLARIEIPEKDIAMTLVCSEQPVFFELKHKKTAIEARFAGSFFGSRAQFRPTEIIPTEDGYKLIYDAKAGYRSQLPEKPETSNWRFMDHSKRQNINIQQFRVEITVHILEDGARFDIETIGCDRVPTKFEFVTAPGLMFENDTIALRTKAGDYVFLKDGKARYYVSHRTYAEIETEKFYLHTYGEDMRGAIPKDPQKFTVCMTADTPQRSTVTLRIKEI